MCFKKLTIKNVLACTLMVLTVCVFSFTLFIPAAVADGTSVLPPPPDADTTIVYTSTGPVDTDPAVDESDLLLSTWDIITVVVSTIL